MPLGGGGSMRTVGGTPSNGGGLTRTDLKVYGMKDAAAAQAARDALRKLEGVEEVRIDIPSRRITIRHRSGADLTAKAIKTLFSIGLRAGRKG